MDNPRDSELLPGASVNNSRAFFLPVSNRAVYVRTSFPLLWAIHTGKLIFCNPWEYPLLSLFPSKIYTAVFQDGGVQAALLRNHECSTWLLSTLCIIRARLWPGLWGLRATRLSSLWRMMYESKEGKCNFAEETCSICEVSFLWDRLWRASHLQITWW